MTHESMGTTGQHYNDPFPGENEELDREGSGSGNPSAGSPSRGNSSHSPRGQQNSQPEEDITMEDILASGEADYRTLHRNEIVDGVVMGFDNGDLIVDVGGKSEGIVPASELTTLSDEEKESLEPGQPIVVSVLNASEDNEGRIVLSVDRARAERLWRELQQKLETGEIVDCKVVGYNKGGLLVDLGGVRGFIPSSQISFLVSSNDADRQSELANLVGRTLQAKVIEVNRKRNRLILSERIATQERKETSKERLIEELREGQIVKGRVTSLADFGAFVDIGGADGLIHLSEISWGRINHPSEVLKPGDEVDVMVLNIDREHKKIALSMKRTQPEPWATAMERYDVGQIVEGEVTQIAPFGVFVRLEDGIEGLVHMSELGDTKVQVGDKLRLRVIKMDTQRRRIGLSVRQLDEPDYAAGEGEEESAEGGEREE